jgi:peptide/nickel transport system substrate-binding protein
MSITSLKKLFLISAVSILTVISSFTVLNAQGKVSEKEKYGGTLTIAIPFDTKSLDSRYLPGSANVCLGYEKIYDRLVDYAAAGASEVIPMIAESWKQIDDVTWLVNIRKGVKFHNGKELTAEDIWKNIDWKLNPEKYTKERGWRPPRVRGYTKPVIKKLEIIDKYVLKFTLMQPYAPFVNATLNWALQGIIDPDVVEKWGQQATLHPIGTGPFKLAKWVSGDHITLESFNGYWGGRPYLDRVVFRVIPDGQTRLLAFQKGEVDAAVSLPLTSLPQLKKDPRLRYFLIRDITRGGSALYFNLRRWPMNQLKFRQAVAMGVDWTKITKAAFPEGTALFYRSFLKGSWAEDPGVEKLLPSYSPEKAKKLLKEVETEAGKPLPREIDGMTSVEPLQSSVMMMAADQLKKVGINLKVRILEQNIVLDISRRQPRADWDLMIDTEKGPGFDPSAWSKQYNSKQVGAGDGKTVIAYANPEFDKLDDSANIIYDRKKRKNLYQEMEKIIFRDLPIIPIFNIPYVFGYNYKVHDIRNHNSGFLFLRSPWNNVWVEKGGK